MRNRVADAHLDALIHETILRDTGVLEPDEPTAFSHATYMAAWRKRMYGEFTPQERCDIRMLLGLGVEAREARSEAEGRDRG